MEDAFYNRGLDATSTSNIFCSYGYSVSELLKTATLSFMDDDDAYNNDVVGHRRWILNPTLKYIGFGYAKSAEWDYVDLKVFDRSGSPVNYDFIGWPAEGNFPVNLISRTTPWSITLNPSKYQTPQLDQVKITITRQSDGKTWSFDKTTGTPGDPSKAFFTIDTAGYGVSNCMIFNPGSANVDNWFGLFTVDVTGLKTATGAPAELHYQVDFFDVETCDHHTFEAQEFPATCDQDGRIVHTCIYCGEEVEEPIPALGHDYTDVVTAPTCVSDGFTTHTCSRCGHSYTDNVITASGHNYEITGAEATCTTPGSVVKTCTGCGDTQTETVDALGHDYTSVVTPATCTEAGFTTHTCSRCNDTYTDGETAATGHSYQDQVTDATCTAGGHTTQTCTTCGHSQTVNETAALGHNYESTVTEANCVNGGGTTYTCSRCGDSYTDAVTEALGHNYESTVTEAN